MSINRQEYLIHREASKPGLRGKINAKCIECIYEENGGGGSWREQVGDCTAPLCPLYPVRPMPSDRRG